MKRTPRVVRPLIAGAGAPLLPIPPRPSGLLLRMIPVIAPLYRRFGLKLAPIESETAALRRMLSEAETLTFVAFRHPSPDDAQVVYQTIRRAVPGPVFLYGRGVPVWSGPLTAWVLPRIGAFSVFPGTVNRESMTLLKGSLPGISGPICLAPEAQVTYHNYRVAPIQRGTAALALDAAAGTPDRAVRILPLGLEYRYPDPSGRIARRLLARAEHRLGIEGLPGGVAGQPVDRLWRILGEILRLVIIDAGGDEIAPDRRAGDGAGGLTESVEDLQRLASRALEATLARAEQLFRLQRGTGDPVGRVFRIRARFWERAYPLRRPAGPVGAELHDIDAVEARIAARHLEVADVLSYVDITYLAEAGIVPGTEVPPAGGSAHARFAEYLLTANDLLGRIVGKTIAGRSRWPGRRCVVRHGTIREVPADGRRRAAVGELTDWLSRELTGLSRPSRDRA
jgi:hypothetical protein